MDPAQLFVILLVSGLTLIGAEVFVPGGVLGVVGGLALLGSIITGFIAFPDYGGYIATGIVVLVGVAIVLWIKIFPKSWMGKKMIITQDLALFKGTETDLEKLLGKKGKAISELRPAGFALIDGRRVDVVTQGEMISKEEPVHVIEVESNRVVVRKTENQKTTE